MGVYCYKTSEPKCFGLLTFILSSDISNVVMFGIYCIECCLLTYVHISVNEIGKEDWEYKNKDNMTYTDTHLLL